MTEQVARTEQKEKAAVATPELVHAGPTFSPRVDVIEKPDCMVLLADMPGVSKDNVSVVLEKGVLTIEGEIAMPEEPGMRIGRQEYEVGRFHRAFEVGEGLDPSGVEARIKDGVLRLVIPKSAVLRPRKIEVAGQ
jgi:HSP20 family molecular chaperone IbpA